MVRRIGLGASWLVCSLVLATVSLATAGSSSVTLAWDPSPGPDIVGYTIYLGTNSGNYSTSVYVGNATSATLSNLVAGATYFFAATATDSSGLESEFSNEVSYTVPTVVVPPIPLSIQISSAASSSVNLAWDPNPGQDIARYTVYLGTSSGNYSTSISVGNTASARISNLVAGVTYFFAATATDSSGLESELSNEVTYTVPAVLGPIPLGIQISSAASGSVTLAWDPSLGPDIAGYTIYLGTSSGKYSTTMFVGNVTSVTISNLVAGGTYYFAATAVDTLGFESEFSNELSYTVPTLVGPIPLAIQISPNRQVVLGSTTQPGARISILSSPDLNGSNWTVLGTVTAGSDGSFQFADPAGPTNQVLFYRAQLAP